MNTTNKTTTRKQALDGFGPILIKQGYDWIEIEKVAAATHLDPDALKAEFPSKALLCEAWMEETEDSSRRHHEELLNSDRSARELIDHYFRELESFMQRHEFGGCPFSNTAGALRGRSEPRIERRIAEHKEELRRFFRRVCERESLQSGMLAESLFLIYSGATTESSSLRSLEPVSAGRQAALSLHDLHAVA